MSDKTPKEAMDSVLNDIDKIVARGGEYIFRGETKKYRKISSTLYRAYEHALEPVKPAEDVLRTINMDSLQKQQTIKDAKRYTTEKDDEAILERIQHYGGETNRIDFSHDYLIALFFACDGEPNKHGRLILYDKSRSNKAEVEIITPNEPRERVVAQKSIFVSPKNGVLDANQVKIVIIPETSKKLILKFLQTHHGIAEHTIYNDIHGYISRRKIHKEVDAHIYRGHYYSIAGFNQDARKSTS